MDSFEEKIRLRTATGQKVIGQLTATVDRAAASDGRWGDACLISIQAPELEIEARACDFFGALVRAREQIEPVGWRVLCYGASRNVVTSGMARDMGLGLKAYRTRMGEPTSMEDLVEIFSYGDDVVESTIQEQRAHEKEWMASFQPSSGFGRLLRVLISWGRRVFPRV